MASMALQWEPANRCDPAFRAMDGALLVGQVVRYDVPPGWAAFIHGHRVDGGPWETAARASRSLETAWGAQHAAEPPHQ